MIDPFGTGASAPERPLTRRAFLGWVAGLGTSVLAGVGWAWRPASQSALPAGDPTRGKTPRELALGEADLYGPHHLAG